VKDRRRDADLVRVRCVVPVRGSITLAAITAAFNEGRTSRDTRWHVSRVAKLRARARGLEGFR